jgi:hypothetical protein
MSEGTAGNSSVVRSTLVGKESPERTGYLDELPA